MQYARVFSGFGRRLYVQRSVENDLPAVENTISRKDCVLSLMQACRGNRHSRIEDDGADDPGQTRRHRQFLNVSTYQQCQEGGVQQRNPMADQTILWLPGSRILQIENQPVIGNFERKGTLRYVKYRRRCQKNGERDGTRTRNIHRDRVVL